MKTTWGPWRKATGWRVIGRQDGPSVTVRITLECEHVITRRQARVNRITRARCPACEWNSLARQHYDDAQGAAPVPGSPFKRPGRRSRPVGAQLSLFG